MPIIKELLGAYRIPVLQADGFEADDVIGTLASQATATGTLDTYMLTPDKDYGQLVTDHARIYRPRHGGGYEVMGPAEVCAKYDIDNPGQIIDLLALKGVETIDGRGHKENFSHSLAVLDNVADAEVQAIAEGRLNDFSPEPDGDG